MKYETINIVNEVIKISSWTYIKGVVEVSPRGRTQAEKEYILKTVLSHLPKVTGSEDNMNVYINQEIGYNSSSNCDEFMNISNLGNDKYYKCFETQDNYLITIQGNFRDRVFEETVKEFNNWINRLAKRVMIEDCLVEVKGYNQKTLFTNKNDCYGNMYEWGEDNWCDYLMWNYKRDEDDNLLCGKPK